MTQRAFGEGGEAFGEFHNRALSAASQDDVFECFQLLAQGGVDVRVAVAEQVDPPGADAVKVTFAVNIVEPRALTPGNGDEWQIVLMLLHLGTGVPDGGETATEKVFVIHGVREIQGGWCYMPVTTIRLGGIVVTPAFMPGQCKVCDAVLPCSGISAWMASPSTFG